MCKRVLKSVADLKNHQRTYLSKPTISNQTNKNKNENNNINLSHSQMVNNIYNITNSSHENTPLQNITVDAIEWGHHTEKDLRQILDSTYDEIVFWKKNLFLLPSKSLFVR